MKKLSTLRNSLLLFATLLTISSFETTAQTKLAAPRITQAIDDANLVPMAGRVHSLARSEFDRGVVADSQPVNRMLLQLKRSPEQDAALLELINEQQTRNSPNYRAWLTPLQFGQQFGVADEDIQKVTDWLSKQGFTGIKVAPGRMVIEFSGTAGLVRNAFHTEIHNFMVNGEAHMANVSVPQMPATLAPVVTGIVSLHNFRKKSFLHSSALAARAKAEGKLRPGFSATPCASLGPATCFAMGPADFAKIYNIPSNLDGTNQTIALVERSNIAVSDVNQYGQGFNIANLTNFTAANNIILESSDPGIVSGDDQEATLDVEVAGGVAPKSTILMVVADGTVTTSFSDGVDLAALAIVQYNLAGQMSESFGAAEQDAFTPFISSLWEQAASQGITVTVSTGDTGSASIDGDMGNLEAQNGLSISGTASTPFNVAVGGTDFDDATNPTTYWNSTNSGLGLLSAISYIPETTWNGSCAATATTGSLATCANVTPDAGGADLTGGGGGQSGPCGVQDPNTGACTGPVLKPVWQAGVGVPGDRARDIPDVSLFASNGVNGNFWVMCYAGIAGQSQQNGQPCNLLGPNYNFSGVGGTSASAPAFAAIMALVNQSQAGANPSLRVGNANFVLYPLAQTAGASCNSSLPATITNSSCIFYDITKGNNSVECGAGSLNCSNTGTTGNGVLVEPTGTGSPFPASTPGWMTTTGYDLATGLGSVNVTNLTKNWGSIYGAFQGDLTTITSPATNTVTITHGANVTFNITVAQNSGTAVPTGDVSLIAEPPGFPQYSVGSGTLASGTVSMVTNFLPGDDTTGAGTAYPVVAHYAGDGTFMPSDSAPINVTVNRENSTVQTAMYNGAVSPPVVVTSATYGNLYLFRVDVLGSAPNDNVICANVAIPCPTGTITLTYDGGKPLNDFLNTATGTSTNVATLNVLGLVEDRVLGSTGLPGGSHSVVAAYSGDNSYNPSTAPALAVMINPASTTTTVTANGGSTATVSTGQSVTLVATVSGCVVLVTGGCSQPSGGAGPTGMVTFSACGTATSCTVPVVPTAASNSNGGAFATATLTTSFSSAGPPQNISATFTTADGNYIGCSGACEVGSATVTVTTTGMFTAAATPLTLNSATGASAGSTITVTPAGGFTGIVAVTASTSVSGVTCTPSPLNIMVTGATAVMETLNCQVLATSTTLTASSLHEDGRLEAKAAPQQTAAAKGWWTLSAGSGFAALFLLFLPGRKRFRAALGLGLVCLLSLSLGCGGSGGSSVVTKAATTTKLTVNTGNVMSGTAFTFSVSVAGGTPTGMVQLLDGTTAIGTPAAVSGGTAAPTAPALSVGTHTISAQYAGDSTTLSSSSGALNLTVTGNTTLAITTVPAATPVAPAISLTIN